MTSYRVISYQIRSYPPDKAVARRVDNLPGAPFKLGRLGLGKGASVVGMARSEEDVKDCRRNETRKKYYANDNTQEVAVWPDNRKPS